MSCTLSGTTLTATSDLNLNSTGSVNLSSSGNINLQNGTTTYGTFFKGTSQSDLNIFCPKDIVMYPSNSNNHKLLIKDSNDHIILSSNTFLSLKSDYEIYISPSGTDDKGCFTCKDIVHDGVSTTGFRLKTNAGGNNLILDSFDSGQCIFLIPYNNINYDYLTIGSIISGDTPDLSTGGLLLSSISNMNIKANSGVINLMANSKINLQSSAGSVNVNSTGSVNVNSTGSVNLNSTGSNTNWTQSQSPYNSWHSICCSSSGQYVYSCAYINYIYYSIDYGVNWTQTSSPQINWYSICCSSSGQYVYSCVNTGYIYYSIFAINNNVNTNYVAPYNPFGLGIINQQSLANFIPQFIIYVSTKSVNGPYTKFNYISKAGSTSIDYNTGSNNCWVALQSRSLLIISVVDSGGTQYCARFVSVKIGQAPPYANPVQLSDYIFNQGGNIDIAATTTTINGTVYQPLLINTATSGLSMNITALLL